jgi:hypothetical protein
LASWGGVGAAAAHLPGAASRRFLPPLDGATWRITPPPFLHGSTATAATGGAGATEPSNHATEQVTTGSGKERLKNGSNDGGIQQHMYQELNFSSLFFFSSLVFMLFMLYEM